MMNVETHDWSLSGADDKSILVSTDVAPSLGPVQRHVLFAHGFKGYKDYGFIPVLSACIAEAMPAAVHRFNFSHSGMTDDVSTFARPDLFERDTWDRQVADVNALHNAVCSGDSPVGASGAACVYLGHSRGGSSCLLTAGRNAAKGMAQPSMIVSIAAPDQCCNLSEDAVALLRKQGYIVSPSARTGQSLRIGSEWLREQEASPSTHDILALCGALSCPVLAAHGGDDPTVDPECAIRIARACPHGESRIIAGANHVFNTLNPADLHAPLSMQLQTLCDDVVGFLKKHTLAST